LVVDLLMNVIDQELYCLDLPTTPVPEIGIILVTGATGYIGGRLVPDLIARGYRVRVMVRSYGAEYEDRWPEAEIVIADALKPEQLRKALHGVSVAYYLIHSMITGDQSIEDSDRQAAAHFKTISLEEHVNRVIYLGSLGESVDGSTDTRGCGPDIPGLLLQGGVPVTILRTTPVIGSGSALFEILHHIIRRSPVYFIPSWAHNLCQPIGIRDVIKYLVAVLETEATKGETFDIGGSDILSYREMMKVLAKLLRKRRLFIPSPVAGIRFNSYMISLLSPVPAQLVECILKGVQQNVMIPQRSIKKLVDFKVCLLRALSREQQDKISTRWSDAYPPAHELAIKLSELKSPPRYISKYSILTQKKASAIFDAFCQIGGKQGWFHTNWMWRLRGRLDRILMGVGSSRGRRSAQSLRINDVIDFWRVEDICKDEKLLLRAEMRLPGKAWLEFQIDQQAQQNCLSVIAYFQSEGVAGRLYWYFFLPFHYFIFKDLLKQLTK
jgi:uncharacterized protein YbjT (DUF2867 family)